MQSDLKLLVENKVELINDWINQGKIAKINPIHLIFSIWATTQHYSDFEIQIQLILGNDKKKVVEEAEDYLQKMFTKLLMP